MVPNAAGKRWMWIGLAVAAAAALVVVALLTAQDRPPGGGASAPEGEATATGVPVAEASGTAPSKPGTAPASPGAPQPAPGGSGSAQPPASTAPAAPVDDGQRLATVTVPPSKTLAMIDSTKASADSTYRVTFKVYGYGPGGGDMSSLVVYVSASTPGKDVEKTFDLAKRNVLCRLNSAELAKVSVGGTYDGTITLRLSGGVLVPWLSDVEQS